MTDEEKELQEKMRAEMKTHLTISIGYPNCSYEQIMGQVPNMWNILVHKGLTRPGMSYEMFLHFANKSYTKAIVQRTIGMA